MHPLNACDVKHGQSLKIWFHQPNPHNTIKLIMSKNLSHIKYMLNIVFIKILDLHNANKKLLNSAALNYSLFY